MSVEWERHRIERVCQWLKRLQKDRYIHQAPLRLNYAPADPFMSVEHAAELNYKALIEGALWGCDQQLAWFRIKGSVPSGWRKDLQMALLLNIEGELLLFSEDGNPFYALSTGSVFNPKFIKDLCLLPESVCPGSDFLYYGEAVASGLFGLNRPAPEAPLSAAHFQKETPEPVHVSHVVEARLVALDPAIDSLIRPVSVLLDQAVSLAEGESRKDWLIERLNRAVDSYDTDRIAECRNVVESCVTGSGDADLVYTAVGHAHIDTAWLWRQEESVRKCGRTFASQIEHISRYPEYVFGASSPHHYVWTQQHYPGLFDQIKMQVAAGRWECLGAMWVEADCNISGGEALARQLIYGKRYFQKEFGIDINHLWLPDVFGYSACLPQLLQQVRAPNFMTTKISWNRYNKFPYASFHWQGIDGSRVLTHLPPTNCYNEDLIPSRLSLGRDQYPEKDLAPIALALFGIGDGGGGPNTAHIENGQLTQNLEACPGVQFGTVDGFFKELQQYADALPAWNGELYLELHRGTLTSQADIKRGNRRIEHCLRDTEILFAAFAMNRYPQSELEALWKKFLVHQFHDILPGSCIGEVVEDTLREYREIEKSLDQLWAQWRSPAATSKWAVVNSLNFERNDVVRLPVNSDCCIEAGGEILSTQPVGDEVWVHCDLAGLTSVILSKSQTPCAAVVKNTLSSADFPLTVENDFVGYRLNEKGEIIFAQDKVTGRVFVEKEKANELALYADYPTQWDAWDIDPFYPNCLIGTAQCCGPIQYEKGEVAQILTIPMTVGESALVQRLILPNHRAALEVECRVKWTTPHRLLRVNVPTTVQARTAGCHIQFGTIQRSTLDETSEEQAQFEVAAHEFTDLSDDAFGVALINDGKYGHRAKGQTLSMSLLRAPTYPDPDADLGTHEFRYAVVPHEGELGCSTVVEMAAAFNQSHWVLPGEQAFEFPFRVSGDGIRLEAVKKAEDSTDLILRFYEAKGCSETAVLTLKKICSVEEVNLLEEVVADFGEAGELKFTMRPFEIKTVKVRGLV